MPKLLHVVGARPNFMKIAPLYHALEKCGWCSCELSTPGSTMT